MLQILDVARQKGMANFKYNLAWVLSLKRNDFNNGGSEASNIRNNEFKYEFYQMFIFSKWKESSHVSH